MRPIDADALLEELKKTYHYFDLKFLIDEAPTIESCKSAEQKSEIVPIDDTISRADAIEAVMAEGRNVHASEYANAERIIHEADAVEALAMLTSADRPTLKQTDTLIIADALRYLAQDTERHELDRTRAEELREQILQYGANMCHSADRPTVIRSKTLMPTKDFKEWAKRVRETNPNVIVIPCDAEDVSADRPQVNSNSAEEQIAETCDRPKGDWKHKK